MSICVTWIDLIYISFQQLSSINSNKSKIRVQLNQSRSVSDKQELLPFGKYKTQSYLFAAVKTCSIMNEICGNKCVRLLFINNKYISELSFTKLYFRCSSGSDTNLYKRLLGKYPPSYFHGCLRAYIIGPSEAISICPVFSMEIFYLVQKHERLKAPKKKKIVNSLQGPLRKKEATKS